MKKFTFLLICLVWLLPFAIKAQTATQPAGSGTASDPYKIANIDNLYWVTQNSSSWDKDFIQTADINASATSSWDGGAGFTPIGNSTTPFTGSYNGQGSVIDSLAISRGSTDHVGLFGVVSGADIKRLGITNAHITGRNYVGAVAGISSLGDSTTITYCYTSGTVTGSTYVGGLTGLNQYPAVLENCGSTDTVTGNKNVGGLAGYNSATINNCYATGLVTAGSGGGGLVGGAPPSVTNSFWDTQTSGQANSLCGTGKTTSEMKNIATYTNTATSGLTTAWDFIGTPNNDADTLDYWNIDTTGTVNNGYPLPSWWVFPYTPLGSGSEADPYQIATLNNLYWLSEGAGTSTTGGGNYYKQTADIPAKSTEYIHGGQGFNPIGDNAVSAPFNGYYNGDNHVIGHLYINRGGRGIGLFGYISGGEFRNLGITNASVSGGDHVGILAGHIWAASFTITNCYASGEVSGENEISSWPSVGGLVGFMLSTANDFTVSRSHFSGTVSSGPNYTGGLIGMLNMHKANINNCYAEDSITSSGSLVGGLIGKVLGGAEQVTISKSYSSGYLSGASCEGGLVGDNYTSNIIIINNCYSRCNLAPGATYIGGLIGRNQSASPLEITNSYSTGTATGGTNAGGMIGSADTNDLTTTACFWDTITSGNANAIGNAATPTGMTGESTAKMKTKSTFTNAGWDFVNTWDIQADTNDGYPYLLFLLHPNLQIITVTPFNIKPDSAQSGGKDIYSTDHAITSKGVVWNTTGSPAVDTNLGKTNDGTDTTAFTSTLSGLDDTTTYYVRAYFINNNNDTVYGDEKSFDSQMKEPPAMTPPGYALNFNGSAGYVSLPNESNFEFTDSMTVAVWIKVDAFTDDWQAIVTKGDGSWRLQRYGSTNHIDFGTTGLSNGDLEGTTNVNDGNWHYIAGVFDGSKKYLYVDGSLDASVSVTGTISLNSKEVEIGANSDWSGRNFDGQMDEVRIWNVARDSTELQDNMDTVLTGNETGLVAYYKFDVTSGTWLYDHTGSNNSGRLHNMTNSDWVPSTAPIPYQSCRDGNWSDASNWLDGQGSPTKSWSKVKINSNITLDEDRVVADLTIESGKSLTINSDAHLTVSDSLKNLAGNTGLVLKSEQTATASLLNNTAGTSATVERYIPQYSGAAGWHDLSSPVASQAIRPEFVPNTNPITGNNDFYQFDETQNLWINTKDNSGNWNTAFEDNFVVGKGYNVAYESDVTKTFAGALNTGDFTFDAATTPAITYTSGQGNGWNLMGNPYPSAIAWDSCSKTNLEASVYTYDGDAGQYLSWNGSVGALTDGIIPPMNGFFVKASAGASLTIPNSSRLHTSNNFYKNKGYVKDLLVLKVEGNGFSDQTYIHFNQDATTDFDSRFDAYKLLGIEEAPQLYTQTGNTRLSINVLPYSDEEITIPLSLKVGKVSEYKISVSENTFWETVGVSLKDLQTGKIQDLRAQPAMTVTQGPGSPADRFLLLLNGVTNVEEIQGGNEGIEIYSSDGRIMIKTDNPDKLDVSVYNILGQTMLRKTIYNQTNIELDLTGKPGYYLVTARNKNGTKAKKVFVR